jgi:hypothetical protein
MREPGTTTEDKIDPLEYASNPTGYAAGLLAALDAVLAMKPRLTKWDVHTLREYVKTYGTLPEVKDGD